MEIFYEEYIYAVVRDSADGMFQQFSTIFPGKDYAPRIARLQTALQGLNYGNLHFTSIIDADIYMFGLVFNTVIEGKEIDLPRKDELLAALQSKIIELKSNPGHRGSPSLLKHMRNRVEQSVTIFNNYAV